MQKPDKEALIMRATAVLFLLNLIFFPSLWQTTRNFPVVALFSMLDAAPALIHQIIYALSVLAALFLLVKPARLIAGVAIALIFFSCALDVLRLQPPVYAGMLILLLLLLDKSRFSLKLAIALIYFWCGFHKLNFTYVTHGFGRMMFASDWAGMPYLAVLSALIESSLGVFLLMSRTRKAAVFAALIFHLLILALLISQKWEPFVWPWNLWMMAMVWILFYGQDEKFSFRLGPATVIVLALLGAAPLSNLAGYWNDSLAFKVYSYNERGARVFYANGPSVAIAELGMAATGAPYFPSDWYFDGVFEKLCRADRSIRLEKLSTPGWLDGVRHKVPSGCP